MDYRYVKSALVGSTKRLKLSIINFNIFENISSHDCTLSEQKYFNTVKSTCTNRVIYRLNIEL